MGWSKGCGMNKLLGSNQAMCVIWCEWWLGDWDREECYHHQCLPPSNLHHEQRHHEQKHHQQHRGRRLWEDLERNHRRCNSDGVPFWLMFLHTCASQASSRGGVLSRDDGTWTASSAASGLLSTRLMPVMAFVPTTQYRFTVSSFAADCHHFSNHVMARPA